MIITAELLKALDNSRQAISLRIARKVLILGHISSDLLS